jgi:FAD/FMN-containing dehydrogenase
MLHQADIADFRAAFRDTEALIQPHDPAYDKAREVYNGMIDRRPRLIVRCGNIADVMETVRFARNKDLLLAVRGGGHSGAGLGVCDDGLVLDLAGLRGIRVMPGARRVRVEGGCTQGEMDHVTRKFGLAVPSGTISTVGIGGLALGGGHGYLTRRYGLTIDNLLEADLVLADGRFVTANARQHEDLFWAIRGGGGNFGVVTSFLFEAHPVSTVFAGPMLWPLDRAADIMRFYREFMPGADEDLNGHLALLKVPPVAPFPEDLHGETMCGIIFCYLGPLDRADAMIRPFRSLFPPAFERVGPIPFPVLQSALDPIFLPGLQGYWRCALAREIGDEAVSRHVEFGSKLPTPLSTMHLYPIDGRAGRVGKSETAFSYREARWSTVIAGLDPNPGHLEKISKWADEYWNALHPYTCGGEYVNFMMHEGAERVKVAYRDNYGPLAAIKKRYDPTNLFRVNQNINPDDA